LGLAEDLGKLHDAERATSRQGEQAQPGRFGGGTETGEQLIHSPIMT
jgi:hypothetical protein